MYMPYSNNPNLPRVRRDAVNLVRAGWSVRKVALHFGFTHSAIVKWVARASRDGRKLIVTKSSKPHHHPKEISHDLESLILAYRHKYQRDAFFIHHLLKKEGIVISLSSVKRTLVRNRLTYPSRMKIWHQYPPRPKPEKPGMLVEIDTIHIGVPEKRLYVYTLLDVHSRWAHAIPSLRISAQRSSSFVQASQEISPFDFQTIQSDHGPEFSKWFTKKMLEQGFAHRHSRIRTPNDNAHLERFNRTIQQECINRIPRNFELWQKEIPEYLHYYNTQRPHMGLGMKTPVEILTMVPSY
jgi:transposase InsO family protein